MSGAPQGYIGRNPGDGRTVINRQTSHVTTGVQTSFTMNSGYEVGFLDVYLNGIKQTETLDFTASDGITINFSPSFAPMNGDVLEFVAFETLNITNIKSARRNFDVGRDLTVDGSVTIGSSLTVATDLVVNGTFTTINTEILDVEDKTVGIASTSSPSNTTADGAGIAIYGGSDGDKSITWNSTKSNFVVVGGGVSIGTGVTISTPAANVLAFSVNSAEKARFNNFGAFTVGYEGEAWHESTYVGVLQAGSGAWIGQTPGASARAEWVNNAYYDSVNTRWEYIAADEANRIYLENGELHLQSAASGSADGLITWNERLAMTVGGDFKIGPNAGIGITLSSSGNIDAIGIITATTFKGGFELTTGTFSDDVTFTGASYNVQWDKSQNALEFSDNAKATFGGGADLSIYHDGSHSYIDESTGSGRLKIRTGGMDITSEAGAETMATFNMNGAVDLYYDNSKKFETTSDGINIPDGILQVQSTSCNIDLMETGGPSDHTRLRQNNGNFYLQKLSGDKNTSTTAILVDHGNEAVELYQGGNKKFETTSTGATLSGNLSIDANVIHNGDTDTMLSFSASNQVDIVCGGNTMGSFTSTGLALGNNARIDILDASGHRSGTINNADSGANSLRISADPDNSGSNTVITFHIDGSEKARVDSSGNVVATGNLFSDNLISQTQSNSHSMSILARNAVGNQVTLFKGTIGGASELYHNSSKKFETSSSGCTLQGSLTTQDTGYGSGSSNLEIQPYGQRGYINWTGTENFYFRTGTSYTARWIIDGNGHFKPGSDNTYDLGSTGLRWRNLYTTDLQLSNEGKSNDVDGTWGNYTIQEGESDLFLINNRSGKKYKFNLTEVS